MQPMSRSKHPLSRQWNDLHDAAEKGEASESELKQLLTRFNVDVRSPDLSTALHYAARKGNTMTVNFLLGAGANPDVQNKITMGKPRCMRLHRWGEQRQSNFY